MKKFIAGDYKINYYKKNYEYKSFSPTFINKDFDCSNNRIYSSLAKSERLLGQLNAFSTLIPDIDFFIQMHVVKEAAKSSRIEGTQTEVGEAVLPKNEIKPEKRSDWMEVQNYIKAINYAIDKLDSIPLCVRLLKETHKMLLSGVRGEERQPGEIRTSQNWIGGSNLDNAIFIPPHYTEVPVLLTDLEKFLHNKDITIPELIKIAISHYQFETIHPFFDGNGRIGRLLITLQLVDYDILDKPTLYISDFFEKNKGSYYDILTLARQNNDLERWIIFFLSGVTETAENGSKTFKKIVELRKNYESTIRTFGRLAERGGKLLLIMFSKPIITISEAAKLLNVSYNSVNRLMNLFLNKKIVNYFEGKYKTRFFVLEDYLELFR
jgi:Fic family protein